MNNNELPTRTMDTMSDAIAMSSPGGRMSKRAREAAQDRLAIALFGPSGRIDGGVEPTADEIAAKKKASLLRSAKNLRNLAALGMKPRAYVKAAERLEAEAANC